MRLTARRLRKLTELGLEPDQFKAVLDILLEPDPKTLRNKKCMANPLKTSRRDTTKRPEVTSRRDKTSRSDVPKSVPGGYYKGGFFLSSLTFLPEPLSETSRTVVARARSKKCATDEYFEKLKEVYPARKGSYGWTKARKAFDRWIAKGIDPQTIVDGAEKYAELMGEVDRLETEFVKMPITWLNQEGWKDAEEDIREFKLNGRAVNGHHG